MSPKDKTEAVLKHIGTEWITYNGIRKKMSVKLPIEEIARIIAENEHQIKTFIEITGPREDQWKIKFKIKKRYIQK